MRLTENVNIYKVIIMNLKKIINNRYLANIFKDAIKLKSIVKLNLTLEVYLIIE